MEGSIHFSVPEILVGNVEFSDVYANYTQAGNISSFAVDMELPDMKLHKTVKTKDDRQLAPKIEQALATWANQYARHLEKEHKSQRKEDVEKLSEEAKQSISVLENILDHTLAIDDAVDWETLKRDDLYKTSPSTLSRKGHKARYIDYADSGKPTNFHLKEPDPAPDRDAVAKEFGFFTRLFRGSKIQSEFDRRVSAHLAETEKCSKENAKREKAFNEQKAKFEEYEANFYVRQKEANGRVDQLRERYKSREQQAIEEYCDLVLENSEYPDYFPKEWDLEYRETNKILIVDYSLPEPDSLPSVSDYSYIASKDEVREKTLSEAAKKKLYDSVIYQMAIRTIHELYEADVIEAIDSIALNGIVTAINPATGQQETKTIVTVSASREEFLPIDLSNIDPKMTFKHLKGVSASSLHGLTPVAPVLNIEKTDKRFIDARAVAGEIDSSTNLAAMDWEDFEHLVTELFEQEFASNGGEVKVTQASADGGVDAVAFDPDPIRGGKIVIQAKRYTNTVGVAAVRDLYGTVMNEGATKGILVTTSDYGKDSYEFAKDKCKYPVK